MYPIVITQSTSPNFQKKIFTFLIIFLKKWSIQESACCPVRSKPWIWTVFQRGSKDKWCFNYNWSMLISIVSLGWFRREFAEIIWKMTIEKLGNLPEIEDFNQKFSAKEAISHENSFFVNRIESIRFRLKRVFESRATQLDKNVSSALSIRGSLRFGGLRQSSAWCSLAVNSCAYGSVRQSLKRTV